MTSDPGDVAAGLEGQKGRFGSKIAQPIKTAISRNSFSLIARLKSS